MSDEEWDFPTKDRYDTLPPILRAHVSRKEYAFMSDEQKNDIVQDYTQPEPEADF